MASNEGIKREVRAAKSVVQRWEQGSGGWLARLLAPLPSGLAEDAAALTAVADAVTGFDPLQILERLLAAGPVESAQEPGGVGQRSRVPPGLVTPAKQAGAPVLPAGNRHSASARSLRDPGRSGAVAPTSNHGAGSTGDGRRRPTAAAAGDRPTVESGQRDAHPDPAVTQTASRERGSDAVHRDSESPPAASASVGPVRRNPEFGHTGVENKARAVANARRALARGRLRPGNAQGPTRHAAPLAPPAASGVDDSGDSDRTAPAVAASRRPAPAPGDTAGAGAPARNTSTAQAVTATAAPGEPPPFPTPAAVPTTSTASPGGGVQTPHPDDGTGSLRAGDGSGSAAIAGVAESPRPHRRGDDLARQLTDAAMSHGIDLS